MLLIEGSPCVLSLRCWADRPSFGSIKLLSCSYFLTLAGMCSFAVVWLPHLKRNGLNRAEYFLITVTFNLLKVQNSSNSWGLTTCRFVVSFMDFYTVLGLLGRMNWNDFKTMVVKCVLKLLLCCVTD